MPEPSLFLARLRLRVHRGAIVYWCCVALIAAVGAVGVLTMLRRATSRGAVLGPTRRVVVANSPVRAGESLAGHVDMRSRPRSTLPIHALSDLPRDRVATTYIAPGEVVVAERVSGNPGSGPAALLPRGTRGVAVAVDDTGPPLRVSDRVDLLASSGNNGGGAGPLGAGEADPALPTDNRAATTVASGVPVVSTRSGSVTVAIPDDQVGAVTAALVHSSVSVVLAGGASGG